MTILGTTGGCCFCGTRPAYPPPPDDVLAKTGKAFLCVKCLAIRAAHVQEHGPVTAGRADLARAPRGPSNQFALRPRPPRKGDGEALPFRRPS